MTPKWGAYIDLEGKIGNQRQLGEGDLFVPLLQNDRTMLFGNIKARMDDSTSTEGNFGLGVRHMLETGWNIGAYGYFDRRKATYGSYFNQITTGIEALSLDWDLRANLYTPEGRRSHQVDSLNEAVIDGTTVLFRGGEERSLRGFDGEVGYRVPVFHAGDHKQWRIFAGAYRFYADGVNAVQGPRVRTELTFDEVPGLWHGSRLTCGGEFQDDVRGKTGFITARLRIPLQIFGDGRPAASLTPMERRMTDPVIRDIDVVSRSGALGAAETAQTVNGNTLAVVSSAGFSDTSLTANLTSAGANSTVILSGTFNTTAATTMQSGQTLMGSGSLRVMSPSGRTATLALPTGTISGTTGGGAGAGGAITMATNSTLSGVTIINSRTAGNAGSQAVVVNNVSGVTIENSTIRSSESGAASAVSISVLGTSTNFVVRNSTISATGSAGQTATALNLNSGALANTYTVAGNTFSATGGTTNNAIVFNVGTVNTAASTGNVMSAGNCNTPGGTISGQIGFTNGTTCP